MIGCNPARDLKTNNRTGGRKYELCDTVILDRGGTTDSTSNSTCAGSQGIITVTEKTKNGKKIAVGGGD